MKYEGPLEVDAGGILLDGPLRTNPRVAIVRRAKHKDWSFPKGHVETEETLEQAALREVKEETGYDADCLGLAGAMAYLHNGDAKTVTYFYLLRRTDTVPSHNLDGVQQVDWLSLPAARARVSYPDLKAFIDRISVDFLVDAQPARRRRRMAEFWADARLDRLRSAIDSYSRELQAQRERTGRRWNSDDQAPDPADDNATLWWRQSADELLDLAKRLAAQGRIDAAWGALQSSQRLSFQELTHREIELRAQALKEEVSTKLSGWRKAAALEALGDARTCPVEGLTEAQELLDQHSNNVYLRLRYASKRVALSAVLVFVALSLLWLATLLGAFHGLEAPDPFVLHDAALFAGVVLLGVLGSMLSLALDNTKASAIKGRIFELATTRIAEPVGRLAVGAASAVLTVAAAQAAVTGGDQPWVFLSAIPAGFSERLVRRSVDALEATATRV